MEILELPNGEKLRLDSLASDSNAEGPIGATMKTMAREIIRLREELQKYKNCGATMRTMAREIVRLREELQEYKNCACWVEYDYRCPVHGES